MDKIEKGKELEKQLQSHIDELNKLEIKFDKFKLIEDKFPLINICCASLLFLFSSIFPSYFFIILLLCLIVVLFNMFIFFNAKTLDNKIKLEQINIEYCKKSIALNNIKSTNLIDVINECIKIVGH